MPLRYAGMLTRFSVDEPSKSPREMFQFGMTQEGPRGLQPIIVNGGDDDDVEDIHTYGIDWETLGDDYDATQHILRDYVEVDIEHGPQYAPRNLANVPCEPIDCSLSHAQVMALNNYLDARYPVRPKQMMLRSDIWSLALEFCKGMSEDF